MYKKVMGKWSAWVLITALVMSLVGVHEANASQYVKNLMMPDASVTGKSFEIGEKITQEDFDTAFEVALNQYNTVEGGLTMVPYGSGDGRLDCVWLVDYFLKYDLGYALPDSCIGTPHPAIKERWDEYLAETGKTYGSGAAALFSWFWFEADESERYVVTEDYTFGDTVILKPEVTDSFSADNAEMVRWLKEMEEVGAIKPGALILWTYKGTELVHGKHIAMYAGDGRIFNTRGNITFNGVKGVSGLEGAIYNMYGTGSGSIPFGIINIMENDFGGVEPTPTEPIEEPTPTPEEPTPTEPIENPTPTPEEPTPTESVENPTPTPEEPTPTEPVENPTPTPEEPTPTPAGSAIRFRKLDASGVNPVAGATCIVLYNANECPDFAVGAPYLKSDNDGILAQDVTSENGIVVATGMTDENGYLNVVLSENLELLGADGEPIAIQDAYLGGENFNLPFGHYIIVEVESAPGHPIDQNCYYRELKAETDRGTAVELTGKGNAILIYTVDKDMSLQDSATISTKTELPISIAVSPEIADEGIEWSSLDESVATVDSNGLVTAHRYGVTLIIATAANGDSSEFELNTLFHDVAGSNVKGDADYQYYYNAVYWAAENGITAGYDRVYFGPERECERREMLIFLWRMAGMPTGYGDAREYFNDVTYDPASASNQAIAWAYKEGITKGYADGGFHPTASITRMETLILLYRVAGKPEVSGKITFPDVLALGSRETSDTYRAILWASQKKITNGYSDGNFQPYTNCLREHIVTFLYRYANLEK